MGSIEVDALNHHFPPPSPSSHQSHPPLTATPRSLSGRSNMSAATSRARSSRPSEQSSAAPLAPQPPASPTLQPAAGQHTSVEGMPPSSRPVAGPESSPESSPSQPASSSDSASSSPRRIVLRDLEHIQSLADSDMQPFAEDGNKSGDQGPQYEISGMPIENIIEMVAGLLTKITTTNDRQHQHLHRQMNPAEGGSGRLQSNSVLAFHGKNVPSITILSYLLRINKYCPTSYEVFLSLLVYFDRMMEKVNAGAMHDLREMDKHERAVSQDQAVKSPASAQPMEGVATSRDFTQTVTPPLSAVLEGQDQGAVPGTPHSRARQLESPTASAIDADPLDLSHLFVVDSFNIHRLVIAGVTCASKFFSDIFYTNSRYAKVGGLPLPELNHLELQFLLLNDFRLSVPVEEIEAYGTTLVEFYAREVLAQRQAEQDDDIEA